jgi:hypothetical protein
MKPWHHGVFGFVALIFITFFLAAPFLAKWRMVKSWFWTSIAHEEIEYRKK